MADEITINVPLPETPEPATPEPAPAPVIVTPPAPVVDPTIADLIRRVEAQDGELSRLRTQIAEMAFREPEPIVEPEPEPEVAAVVETIPVEPPPVTPPQNVDAGALGAQAKPNERSGLARLFLGK